ncbi:hypothetical protein AB838_20610 [Rhodobacteraceae bacterium (ex Bugula neritina AB1)]|nr:hypothetical protein AB838_20610 [Rhodobacteraceae bacterium (ex Bugula neritina AB1)]
MNWYGMHFSAELTAQLAFYAFLALLVYSFFVPIKLDGLAQALRQRFCDLDSHVKAGVWGTGAIILFVFFVSGFEHCIDQNGCTNKIARLLEASPNEVGDALAGFAGALAFLWIIVTVLLQGKELAAQREELKLTRKESEKMAAALEAQAEVFRDEQKYRKEDRLKQFLDEQLQLLVEKMFFYRASVRIKLRLVGADLLTKEGYVEEPHDDEYIVRLFGRSKLEGTTDEALLEFSKNIQAIRDLIDDLPENWEVIWVSQYIHRVDEVIADFEKVEKRISELSESQISRLNRVRFMRTLQTLRKFRAAPFFPEAAQ